MLATYALHDCSQVPDAIDPCGDDRVVDPGGGLSAPARLLLQAYPLRRTRHSATTSFLGHPQLGSVRGWVGRRPRWIARWLRSPSRSGRRTLLASRGRAVCPQPMGARNRCTASAHRRCRCCGAVIGAGGLPAVCEDRPRRLAPPHADWSSRPLDSHGVPSRPGRCRSRHENRIRNRRSSSAKSPIWMPRCPLLNRQLLGQKVGFNAPAPRRPFGYQASPHDPARTSPAAHQLSAPRHAMLPLAAVVGLPATGLHAQREAAVTFFSSRLHGHFFVEGNSLWMISPIRNGLSLLSLTPPLALSAYLLPRSSTHYGHHSKFRARSYLV